MNITDDQGPYVRELYDAMAQEGIRVEVDSRNEKLSLKIREGVVKKVPYLVIAGKKEMEKRTVTVRMRDGRELKDITVQDLISRIKEDNTLRR